MPCVKRHEASPALLFYDLHVLWLNCMIAQPVENAGKRCFYVGGICVRFLWLAVVFPGKQVYIGFFFF